MQNYPGSFSPFIVGRSCSQLTVQYSTSVLSKFSASGTTFPCFHQLKLGFVISQIQSFSDQGWQVPPIFSSQFSKHFLLFIFQTHP